MKHTTRAILYSNILSRTVLHSNTNLLCFYPKPLYYQPISFTFPLICTYIFLCFSALIFLLFLIFACACVCYVYLYISFTHSFSSLPSFQNVSHPEKNDRLKEMHTWAKVV